MKAQAKRQVESPMPTPQVQVYDPLAEYLGGPAEAVRFSISILDAARLSGHLCPSVAGAFLATQAAIKALYPETETCVRGQIEVDLPGMPNEGAMGPISHVISYITGAWSGSGFAGINGQYSRRDLMHFHSPRCIHGGYRFERTDTGQVVHVHYNPGLAPHPKGSGTRAADSFERAWQARVSAILATPEVIEVTPG
jgi:hypothetical protein